jgi:hypothetical protein
VLGSAVGACAVVALDVGCAFAELAAGEDDPPDEPPHADNPRQPIATDSDMRTASPRCWVLWVRAVAIKFALVENMTLLSES